MLCWWTYFIASISGGMLCHYISGSINTPKVTTITLHQCTPCGKVFFAAKQVFTHLKEKLLRRETMPPLRNAKTTPTVLYGNLGAHTHR
jgi:hypothetical protein